MNCKNGKTVYFGSVEQLESAASDMQAAIIVRDDSEMAAFQAGTATKALVHGTEAGVRNRFPSLNERIVNLHEVPRP